MADGNKAVWAALASNAVIMVTKFIGAALGGSSSLLAEALHSVADTGDSIMLLIGKHRAAKPADAKHPFGHGKELYFWTMVVAVSIFTIGGCASIFEGVERIFMPEPIEDPTVTYIILSLAAVFEIASSLYAWRIFFKEKGKRGVWEEIKRAKDPTTFMVVFEDTAAVAGVLIALTAVWLQHHLMKPWIDGAGAVCIGLLMSSVAVFLMYEIRDLLVGERVVPEQLDAMRDLVQKDPDVERVQSLHTMHFGPDTVMVALRTKFNADLNGQAITDAVERLHATLRAKHENTKYIYIEPVA